MAHNNNNEFFANAFPQLHDSKQLLKPGSRAEILAQEAASLSKVFSPPTLQGSRQVSRIRQAGASLRPGEGQGFLGSIQAGSNQNSFDQFLLNLVGGNRNRLTGR